MLRCLGYLGLLGLAASAGPAWAGDDPPQVLWAEPASDPAAVNAAAQLDDGAAAPATTQPAAGNPADPLPGITIDKPRRRVTVQCTSLPPGVPLELIACTPNTREHEAVLTARARPQNIHLALLVCGFQPGHPVGFDEETQKPIVATGDPVDVQVQWTDPKTQRPRTAPIQDWLIPTDPAKPMPRLTWLFTGSRQDSDGSYAADREGSVVSIGNFSDAVIDLAGFHTRDDAQLEFKGNNQVMPGGVREENGRWTGVPCALVLLPPAALLVELDRFGKVSVSGRQAPPDRLPALLAAHKRSRQDARIELTVSPDAVKADVDRLLAECAQAGFAADRIERRAPTTQPGAFTFPINDPRAAIDLLTGQWRQHRLTIARNVSAQRQWFAQLEEGRQTLARQCRELTDYMNRAREQYHQTLAELRAEH